MKQNIRRATQARILGKTVLTALALAGSASTFFVAPDASAQDPSSEPQKVLVGTLTGQKTTSARNWVLEGLNADPRFEVVGSDDGSELKTGASEGEIAEAALGLQADAVILGASRFGRGWNAELEVYDGKDGSLIQKVPIKGGSWANYEAALTGGADYFELIASAEGFPPEEPEPVLEEEPEEEPLDLEEEEEEPESDGSQPSPLDVMLGARLYSRAFRYTDTLEQLGATGVDPLVDYNLDAAPMPMLNLHWYPGAHFTDGAGAHIGITGGYETGIATNVGYVNEDGEEFTFSQNHSLWYAGLRGRIPVDPITFGLGANYGGHNFSLKDSADGSPGTLFPNVNYSFVELGADAEVLLGDILLGAQGAYLLVLGTGDISSEEWFPNAKANGVHFSGHVGYRAFPAMDILGGIDARMYGFNFNPVDASRDADRVAGGATDRYLSAFLALRFRIPEKGDAADDSGDEGGDSGGDSFDSFD